MITIALLLAAASGAFQGFQQFIAKTSTAPRTMLLASFLLTVPVWGAWLTFTGIPHIQPVFWWVVGAYVPIIVAAELLIMTAVRISPLMKTSPYLSLTPVFLLGVSPLLNTGTPTLAGGIAIVGLAGGIYVLNVKEDGVGILDPLRNLGKELGSLLMIAVAALYAIAASLDLLGFKASSVPFYLFVTCGLIGFIGLVFELIRQYFGIGQSARVHWKALTGYGGALTVQLIAQFAALSLLPIVPYVNATKRAGTIIWTTLQGIYLGRKNPELYASESKDLKWRLSGIAIILVSVVVIILFGKI